MGIQAAAAAAMQARSGSSVVTCESRAGEAGLAAREEGRAGAQRGRHAPGGCRDTGHCHTSCRDVWTNEKWIEGDEKGECTNCCLAKLVLQLNPMLDVCTECCTSAGRRTLSLHPWVFKEDARGQRSTPSLQGASR